MKISLAGALSALVLVLIALVGCDHGLSPPAEPATGAIRAYVEYVQTRDDWPGPDSLVDLRFVALRFVPRDTTDLLQLNRLVFSDRLPYRVARDTVIVGSVETGSFLYAGVAQKFGADNFDWRPVGLVEENSGFFTVEADETTTVRVTVDFQNPPQFPPP